MPQKGEGGLTPIETDKVKSGEISTFKACSNQRHQVMEKYEETYFPQRIINAGRARYVERNFEMIDKSAYCVVYYCENYLPPKRKIADNTVSDHQPRSGTKIAYEYAKKKRKQVFLLSAASE